MADILTALQAALKEATPEQLSKFSAPQRLLDAGVAFNTTSRGNTQINLNDMKSTKPSDEDKMRYLLTVTDIFRDAGISVSPSSSSQRTHRIQNDDGNIVPTKIYEAWPCIWYNVSQAADGQIADLKAQLAEQKIEASKVALAHSKQFDELKALMMGARSEPVQEQGTPVP